MLLGGGAPRERKLRFVVSVPGTEIVAVRIDDGGNNLGGMRP
jgi:hypothetical protein